MDSYVLVNMLTMTTGPTTILNTYINAFGIRTDDGDYITDFGDPDLDGGVLEDLIT